MAAQDKKISSLTEWLYENIVDAANIVVAHAGENYRIAMSTIRQYVLGNRVINGIGSNDIPTNGGTQTLANKRLDSPSFNSDTPTLSSAVTATQMNHLQNLDVNVKQALDGITGDIGTVENDVGVLYSMVDALQADKIYSYGIGVGAGATSITILASSISGNKINPYSLSISVYEQTSTLTMKLLNLSDIDIVISNDFLSSITIGDVYPEKTYRIVIRYRLLDE
jgi:hypothetical protein